MRMFEKFTFYTGLFTAKSVNCGLHLIKSPGTSLPGYTAMKISKNFLSYFSKYAEKGIFTITGTNGKTTTAGILAQILKTAENKVIHNEKGANMPAGIATSLAVSYKPFSRFDYAVLESDEAYLTKLYDFIKSDYLVVTNLFRDQLDRYGELDATAKMIQNAIDKNPSLKLIVNADDPMLFDLGNKNERIFFGFDEIENKTSSPESLAPPENVACTCGGTLSYEKRYYAHVGKFFCDACSKKRPEPKYSAKAVIYDDYSEIHINDRIFKTSLPGLYNAYNVLAAISSGLELKISPETIQAGLDSYKTAFGRAEKLTINGKNLLIQLIKNPTGASEVLRTVNQNAAQRLLININDNYADGRDMSWLWDTDFELLKDYPNTIVTSGIRAYDMAVRMKYAGFDETKIEVKEDIEEALKYSLDSIQEGEQLLVMTTYTALLEMQKIFQKLK